MEMHFKNKGLQWLYDTLETEQTTDNSDKFEANESKKRCIEDVIGDLINLLQDSKRMPYTESLVVDAKIADSLICEMKAFL